MSARIADRQPMPEVLAPGLDLFAAAWLEEWTGNGGAVIARPDGPCSISYPPEPMGSDYPEPDAALPESVRASARLFASAHYSGRMRAMVALLDAVPHAREALQAHMRSHALGRYYAGQPGGAQ